MNDPKFVYTNIAEHTQIQTLELGKNSFDSLLF